MSFVYVAIGSIVVGGAVAWYTSEQQSAAMERGQDLASMSEAEGRALSEKLTRESIASQEKIAADQIAAQEKAREEQIQLLQDAVTAGTLTIEEAYKAAGEIIEPAYANAVKAIEDSYGGLTELTEEDIAAGIILEEKIEKVGKYGGARGILEPYADPWALNLARDYMEDPSKIFDLPGVEFQFEQGERALENVLSKTTGGGLSGAGIKAATEYGQNFAATQIDKALTRLFPFIDVAGGAATNIANLEVGKGTAIANLAVGEGETLAGFKVGEGTAIANLGVWGAGGGGWCGHTLWCEVGVCEVCVFVCV